MLQVVGMLLLNGMGLRRISRISVKRWIDVYVEWSSNLLKEHRLIGATVMQIQRYVIVKWYGAAWD